MDDVKGRAELIGGLANAMGLGASVHRSGTTVVPAKARTGSNACVAYAIERHLVLWCDPSTASDLSGLGNPARTKSLDEIGAWAQASGWELVGRGHMQLRASGARKLASPGAGLAIRTIDRDDERDRELVSAFSATLSEGDRDEAELEEGDLDEHMLAIVDAKGIAAYASQQPFDYADGFGDIAVATRPDVRGRGLGRTVVASLCAEIVDGGLFPLYRRAADNLASVHLSASLGFVSVVELAGFKRP